MIGFWAGDQNNFQFVEELIKDLSDTYSTRKFDYSDDVDELKDQMKQVDLGWFEWGNGPIIPATQQEEVKIPIINRIHRYEVYSESPKYVHWDKVSRLLFSSPSMIKRFEQKFPNENEVAKKEFVPIGVDLDKFSFSEKPITKELLYVGRIHPHKNPSQLLQIMAKLISIDNEYKLRVVGSFADELYEEYFYDQISKLKLQDSVEYCGQIPHDEMRGYVASADSILITSIIEGLSQATLEVMACGGRPVIANYFGAEEGYPDRCIYNTIDEAVEMIINPQITRPESRSVVEDRYNLSASSQRIRQIIEELL